MSIGPSKYEQTEISRFDRIRHTVKKSVETYFLDPVHYLLYIALFAVIIVLLAGQKIQWGLWVLISIFAVIKFLRSSIYMTKIKKDGKL